MFSKSISERSAPHQGIGRRSKCFRALSRYLRIQSGSDLSSLISSTTCADRPRFGSKTAWDGSFQSKRYPLESSLRCSSWLTAMSLPWIGVGGHLQGTRLRLSLSGRSDSLQRGPAALVDLEGFQDLLPHQAVDHRPRTPDVCAQGVDLGVDEPSSILRPPECRG